MYIGENGERPRSEASSNLVAKSDMKDFLCKAAMEIDDEDSFRADPVNKLSTRYNIYYGILGLMGLNFLWNLFNLVKYIRIDKEELDKITGKAFGLNKL